MNGSASVPILLLLGLLVLLCGGCLYLLLRRNRFPSSPTQIPVLEERLAAREAEIARLQGQLASLEGQVRTEREQTVALRENLSRQETLLQQERNQNEEKLRLLQSAREQMSLEFRNLANEILEQKGKSFSETSQKHIQDILKPLGEKIQLFEQKVEHTYGEEAKQRFALQEQIKSLVEANTRISVDAVNLTNALKGESKTRGIWGEVILERVLEKSGLQKGREYEVQASLKDESGARQQPDVVVRLPENKHVIIDSKVTLAAYEAYFSGDDEEVRKQQLKEHIKAVRKHIRELSEKNYQNLGEAAGLDFVLMFLPIEAAFTLAIQEDERLFTDAFEKNIILVGPSTLLATLRTIQNIWRYEYQNKNALDIASRAGLLYDKFVAFAQDLEKIGERLDQAQKAYDDAHHKLSSGRGNLSSQVEKLKSLGARATKQLPGQLLEDDSTTAEEGEDD